MYIIQVFYIMNFAPFFCDYYEFYTCACKYVVYVILLHQLCCCVVHQAQQEAQHGMVHWLDDGCQLLLH
jgi:hypothetical protein